MPIDPDFANPLYTPPRLRITASYQTASSGGLDTVDIELNDTGTPITAGLVGEIVLSLLHVTDPAPASRPASAASNGARRPADLGDVLAGSVTLTVPPNVPPNVPQTTPTTTTATYPPPATYFNLDTVQPPNPAGPDTPHGGTS